MRSRVLRPNWRRCRRFSTWFNSCGPANAGSANKDGPGLKRDHFTTALCEAAAGGVTDAPRQVDGLFEMDAHLVDRVGVGTECDRQLVLRGELEKARARVNL